MTRSVTGFDFDPDAVRERYGHERDKRLRTNGPDQYLEMSGKYAHFADGDPYADPTFDREPIADETDIAIIGGGFSGLLAAARLSERGLTNFRIVEAGGDFGGTWYWNRYPGAQCDTDAYCYLPLLEELGYVPKEKYAYVKEIFDHSQRIGRHYGLYERAMFRTRVRSIDWDDEIERWHVSTDRDDAVKARFVIMAMGTTTRAKLPGIPGIESFKGHSFHTSRWDYSFTGGDTDAPHDEARRQEGRRDRYRCDSDPVRAAPRTRRRPPLRLPTHSLDRGLAEQPADRPRLVHLARARLAAPPEGELHRSRPPDARSTRT